MKTFIHINQKELDKINFFRIIKSMEKNDIESLTVDIERCNFSHILCEDNNITFYNTNNIKALKIIKIDQNRCGKTYILLENSDKEIIKAYPENPENFYIDQEIIPLSSNEYLTNNSKYYHVEIKLL